MVATAEATGAGRRSHEMVAAILVASEILRRESESEGG
jgi:hypothetical protein